MIDKEAFLKWALEKLLTAVEIIDQQDYPPDYDDWEYACEVAMDIRDYLEVYEVVHEQ